MKRGASACADGSSPRCSWWTGPSWVSAFPRPWDSLLTSVLASDQSSDAGGVAILDLPFIAILAVVPTIFLGQGLHKPLERARRMSRGLRRGLRPGLVFAGLAIGAVVYQPHWTEVRWVPILWLIGAALAVVIPTRHEARIARIKRIHQRVDGVVDRIETTNISRGGGEGSLGIPYQKFSVRFVDAEGITRWVTRTRAIPYAQCPVVGDHLPVYFDAAHPGSTRRILVDFDHRERRKP